MKFEGGTIIEINGAIVDFKAKIKKVEKYWI